MVYPIKRNFESEIWAIPSISIAKGPLPIVHVLLDCKVVSHYAAREPRKEALPDIAEVRQRPLELVGTQAAIGADEDVLVDHSSFLMSAVLAHRMVGSRKLVPIMTVPSGIWKWPDDAQAFSSLTALDMRQFATTARLDSRLEEDLDKWFSSLGRPAEETARYEASFVKAWDGESRG
ncbi:hypothetical protein VDGL01_01201 [Verticillium dahliae]